MRIDSQRPYSLSIDKISLTCSDTHPDLVERSCNQLLQTGTSGFSGLQIRSGRRHHLQCTLPINGSSSSLLIQAGPRHSGISDYRFEFNPSVIGRDGLDQLRSFIDSQFETGTRHLFSNGKITRIDLALDLDGLALEQVIVRGLGSRKHSVHTGQNGEIETCYLGSGTKNRVVAYTKESEDATKFLRLERRMKPYFNGCELRTMPNPFTKVQMVSTNSLLPHLDGMIPRQFFDSVRMRGIGRAIAELPPKQRKSIKNVMADPSNSLMPSIEQVWDSWPDLLYQSGLGALCGLSESRAAA
jgi:hypothetical protein